MALLRETKGVKKPLFLGGVLSKGHDRAHIEVADRVDEIQEHLDARYMGSTEAAWRMFSISPCMASLTRRKDWSEISPATSRLLSLKAAAVSCSFVQAEQKRDPPDNARVPEEPLSSRRVHIDIRPLWPNNPDEDKGHCLGA